MKMFRAAIWGAGLLLLGLGMGLLLLEGGLRILTEFSSEETTNQLWRRDEVYGWAFVPGREGWFVSGNHEIKTFVTINSKGIRDKEHSYEKRHKFRILVLGDSFSAGLEVPLQDCFPKVLESLLNEGYNSGIEVINAGVTGWSTGQELLFFMNEGYKYQPNLVLLSFTLNDPWEVGIVPLKEETSAPRFTLNQKEKLELARRSLGTGEIHTAVSIPKGALVPLKTFLAKHSKLYVFVGNLLAKRSPRTAKLLMRIGLMTKRKIAIDDAIPLSYFSIYAPMYSKEWEDAWRVTGALLSQLKREVEGRGAKFVVVVNPYAEQIYPDQWVEIMRIWPELAGKDWDLNKPNKYLERFLALHHVPFLQLLPGFQEHIRRNPRESLYVHSVVDIHWNSKGHRLAAQLIHAWLTENGLLYVK